MLGVNSRKVVAPETFPRALGQRSFLKSKIPLEISDLSNNTLERESLETSGISESREEFWFRFRTLALLFHLRLPYMLLFQNVV